TGASLPRGTGSTAPTVLPRGADGARIPIEEALQFGAKMGENRRGYPGCQSPEGDGPRRIPQGDHQLPRMRRGPEGVLTALVNKVQRECAYVVPAGRRWNRQLHARWRAGLSESDDWLEAGN